MPAFVEWGDTAKTYLLVTYLPVITQQERIDCEAEINTMLDDFDAASCHQFPVHCIVDVTQLPFLHGDPGNVVKASVVLEQMRHPRRGTDITIGLNFPMQTMISVLAKTGNRSAETMYFCDTLEQAISLVATLNSAPETSDDSPTSP